MHISQCARVIVRKNKWDKGYKMITEKIKSRWDYDLINRIVFALNEAAPIEDILKDVPADTSMPPSGKRLDLRGIDFSFQNLRGPWHIMEGRRLRMGVDLHDADLTGADLSWAMLPRANLRGALLADANLQNTELIYADFSEADLKGARMEGAWLLDTLFKGAEITEQQLAQRRKLGQLDFDYHAYKL